MILADIDAKLTQLAVREHVVVDIGSGGLTLLGDVPNIPTAGSSRRSESLGTARRASMPTSFCGRTRCASRTGARPLS
jgi:predicted cation transporter